MESYEIIFHRLMEKYKHLTVSEISDSELGNYLHVIQDEAKCSKVIGEAEEEELRLQHSVNELKKLHSQMQQQLNSVRPILEEIEPLLSKLNQLEQLKQVLLMFNNIKTTHEKLEQCMNVRDKEIETKIPLIINLFENLKEQLDISEKCKSDNLKQYVMGLLRFWNDILVKKFKAKFLKVMQAVGWPCADALTLEKMQFRPTLESLNQFALYFNFFLKIDTEAVITAQNHFDEFVKRALKQNIDGNANDDDCIHICLAMQLMLIPFNKKFRFHFERSDSKINRLDKVSIFFNTFKSFHFLF